ncbi:hypothetical protein CI238_12977 [Colletotrichum incanum]|uniref:Uncharacterized protein n=1 Tax=Colletotrichum incanum TaxID=1573173 RepID=A0A167DIF6_COLIC|nr:hypothetical protein CI238_12977 [Colletotrichum incanum]
MTAGQSYYFKVRGIPIRVGWVRRDFISTTKALKYTAMATSLTWFNENPDMLRAWLTYAGFGKRLCTRIICYGRSRDYIINNESIKNAYYAAATNEKLPERRNKQRFVDTLAEALHSKLVQLSLPKESIEHVLQDFTPSSKNLYVIGENLRSYGIRTKRLDFDGKVYDSLEKGYV